MRTVSIVRDLTESLLLSGGQVIVGKSYRGSRRVGTDLVIDLGESELVTQQVILSTGRALKQQLGDDAGVRVVASPLLVAYPAVCDVSWARLTPFRSKTINHLLHFAAGQAYSVIGGDYVADPDSPESLSSAKDRLRESALRVFPALAGAEYVDTYISYKTEVPRSLGERNYEYFIREVDPGVFAVVPGKFSLGFSLAVNCYKRLTGADACRDLPRGDARQRAMGFVQPMRHEQMVLAHLASARSRSRS